MASLAGLGLDLLIAAVLLVSRYFVEDRPFPYLFIAVVSLSVAAIPESARQLC
jgi:hypothetical protein